MPPITKFDEHGRELPDPTPLELPAGLKRPESLQESIRRMIRTDFSAYAESHGEDTWEEANDFDVDEDEAEIFPTHHELAEEVIDAQREVNKERAAKESGQRDGRRAVRETEEEGRSDEVQEGAVAPSDGAGVSRPSSKKVARSAQRRPSGRREHAQSSTDVEEDS